VSAATYTAAEVADLIGVGVSTIYDSVKEGTCPVDPIHVGRRMVWSRAAVDALLGLEEGG